MAKKNKCGTFLNIFGVIKRKYVWRENIILLKKQPKMPKVLSLVQGQETKASEETGQGTW